VRCERPFEAGEVTEIAAAARRRGLRIPDFDPSSRGWQLVSIPVAAALVVGGLLLIQGDDPGDAGQPVATVPGASELPAATEPEAGTPTPGVGEAPAGDADTGAANAAAEIVNGERFTLALPQGWEKVDPPDGAAFRAIAADGQGEATLWIEEDANLTFDQFIEQSLRQLETLTPNPTVSERLPAPSLEQQSATLTAAPPKGQPTYEVLLRAAGPYRYYLSATLQPDASREAADGVDLLTGSFVPEAG
jgi:hypothetical protein